MKSTYYVIKGIYGHYGLYRRLNDVNSFRIYGSKPWGGGKCIKTFRSRGDNAAEIRFKKEFLK